MSDEFIDVAADLPVNDDLASLSASNTVATAGRSNRRNAVRYLRHDPAAFEIRSAPSRADSGNEVAVGAPVSHNDDVSGDEDEIQFLCVLNNNMEPAAQSSADDSVVFLGESTSRANGDDDVGQKRQRLDSNARISHRRREQIIQLLRQRGVVDASGMLRTDPKLNADGVEEEPDICVICTDKLKDDDRAFADQCIHGFCFGCITRWCEIRTTCPVCRVSIRFLIHSVQSAEDFRLKKLKPLDEPLSMQAQLLIFAGDDRWVARMPQPVQGESSSHGALTSPSASSSVAAAFFGDRRRRMQDLFSDIAGRMAAGRRDETAPDAATVASSSTATENGPSAPLFGLRTRHRQFANFDPEDVPISRRTRFARAAAASNVRTTDGSATSSSTSRKRTS